MNKKSSALASIALLACSTGMAAPVSEQRTWQERYPVSSEEPVLFVRNIWGNVIVRASETRDIAVTITEVRTAPTQQWFERSKEVVRLEVDASDKGVSMIVGNPHREVRGTNLCRGCRVDYQFEISAPPGAQVDVGTVTDGRVEVTGFRGLVNASNVNGPVSATDLSDCAHIESVNGELDVRFARTPGEDCTIETVNGRITIGLPADAGLDAILSVDHGEVESEFDIEPMALPAKIEKQDHEGRHDYHIVQSVGVRLGTGGATFTFASLNGDVRILKNQ